MFEISTDEHALKVTWVSIRVIGGDMSDWHVKMMVEHRINVMVPIGDALEIMSA